SLWCGVVIAIVAPYVWAKVLGILYPLLTTAVIVGTANHYVLDAIGGAVIVTAGFALQYVFLGVGRRPHEEAPPLSATMGAAVARARGLVPGLVRQRGGQHDDAEPVAKDRSGGGESPEKGAGARVERHDQRV
ncbi:phosphatase PAP2 family protein, partial [Streptomyces albiflaviniger]|nr:phosphatase PAP2 family protein [Streptomyces albiflaviniger]